MDQGTRLIAKVGVAASGALALCDGIASVMGTYIILPVRKDNALTIRDGLTTFTSKLTLVLWAVFLLWEWLSNLVSVLDTYSGVSVRSWDSALAALDRLDTLAAVFAIIISFLLSLSPFLFCCLYNLATSEEED